MFQSKKKIMVPMVLTLFLAAGCVIEVDNSDQTEGEGEDQDWTEGLSRETVVQMMLITVDLAPSGEIETGTQDGVAQMKHALTGDAIRVEWSVPRSFCFGFCEQPTYWAVEQQNEDGAWEVLELDINYSDDGEMVVYWVDIYWDWDVSSSGLQFVEYFRINLYDMENGEWSYYSNIVTFMVFPHDNPIEITLLEASAEAPSQLFVEYGQVVNGEYDYAEEQLFVDNENPSNPNSYLSELTLPMTYPLSIGSTLPANSPIKFTLRTDFSDERWGFENDTVVHQSNTSFCKTSRIFSGLPSDVAWRFQFEFEDLPLEHEAIEANGVFDYNDLVFQVDIMEL